MTPAEWDFAIRMVNTGLNLLVIPALWVLIGIKTQLATIVQQLIDHARRLDRLESKP